MTGEEIIMSEYAIEVENLSVCYKGLKSYSIKKNLFRRIRSEKELFRAVNSVSFKLQKGEILGIVGKNGSGKSTLLKAIAGIFTPDEGSVNLHNNTVSLLAIGVGFIKELSGRENILLSGLLLGFTEDEIKSRTDEIIEFSELGSFIDKPVNTYSSGMYSKLSFAITAILETDIILIDEVLSVGDARFRKKSFAKMKEMINQEDRTVIIVSHDSKTLISLCDKLLWINDGEMMMFGETKEVLSAYESYIG